MEPSLTELLAKNFGILGVGISFAYVIGRGLWNFAVLQLNKKDETITAQNKQMIDILVSANNAAVAANESIVVELKENNKLLSNLLILNSERREKP